MNSAFDDWWKRCSGWYDPNDSQGLAEEVLAKAAWTAAEEEIQRRVGTSTNRQMDEICPNYGTELHNGKEIGICYGDGKLHH